MEVTSSNFKQVLPQLKEVLNNATFIAIDCEFSGLNVVSDLNAFDTPKEYYEKVRKNCKDFLVLQYGISAFRLDSESNVFKQQSYNFYIFRKPINKNIPDQRFLCQTSSINFLTSQGFDFNKLFQSGISYLNISEETVYREKMEERHKFKSNQIASQGANPLNKVNIPIPEELESRVDSAMKQIEEFLTSEETEELVLTRCDPFMRRILYETAGAKFPNKLIIKTKQLENRERALVVTRFKNREEQEDMIRKHQEEELQVLDDFIGFTKVLRLIIDSGKLVVGHNMCLDFLHTIDKFATPLSEDYEEFKECAHTLFKNILDTKFMANSEPFKELISSTVLKDVLDSVTNKPFFLPRNEIENGGQGYQIADQKEHEAGYDAYITGLSFLSMWNFLGTQSEETDFFKDFTLLQPFLNKLYLMMLRDSPYINLAGPDPNPSRDHVFYLTFPKEWKTNNIYELFSPFGNVYISFLNDSSAYIALNKKDQAAVALSTLSQSETYKIMTFAKRQSQLNGNSIPLPSPAPTLRRKRTHESAPNANKKRKADHFGQSSLTNRFLPIMEDVESEQTPTKTFAESSTWE